MNCILIGKIFSRDHCSIYDTGPWAKVFIIDTGNMEYISQGMQCMFSVGPMTIV
jgi:hypothetical protein